MTLVGRYWRTLRHLTARQVFFQVWYRLTARTSKGYAALFAHQQRPARATTPPHPAVTFVLLNQTVTFSETINWNYARNGKLWTYHLTYFEFLYDDHQSGETGLWLIHDFISQYATLRDGREPYPTSLRLINWIRFLRDNQVQDARIDSSMWRQTRLLRNRLEYHIGGNHLLQNGFALLMVAVYFRHDGWLRKAIRLVRTELNNQILADGGHYERSPAYHRDLLDQLRIVTAFLAASWRSDTPFVLFLDQKAAQMQCWLDSMTFQNGDIPTVNDGVSTTNGLPRPMLWDHTTPGPAPITYRMIRRARYELLADVGAIGPACQPGHAHADSLSFLLYVEGKPVLVDTGTSTYEPGQRRQHERSTAAHNTVEAGGQDSSEVWATFRVGRRANTTILTDTGTTLTAQHDGCRHLGLVHQRTWTLAADTVRITDRLIGNSRQKLPNVARFHVHPDVPVQRTSTGATVGPVRLAFLSSEPLSWQLTPYEMADGFNQLRPGICLEVTFETTLETTISLSPT